MIPSQLQRPEKKEIKKRFQCITFSLTDEAGKSKENSFDSCKEERAGLITDLGLMPPKGFVIRHQAGFDNHLCSL